MGAIGKVLHDALPSIVLFEALRHTKKKKGGAEQDRVVTVGGSGAWPRDSWMEKEKQKVEKEKMKKKIYHRKVDVLNLRGRIYS